MVGQWWRSHRDTLPLLWPRPAQPMAPALGQRLCGGGYTWRPGEGGLGGQNAQHSTRGGGEGAGHRPPVTPADPLCKQLLPAEVRTWRPGWGGAGRGRREQTFQTTQGALTGQNHLQDCQSKARPRPDTKKMYLAGPSACHGCSPWVDPDVPPSSAAVESQANPPGQRTWASLTSLHRHSTI